MHLKLSKWNKDLIFFYALLHSCGNIYNYVNVVNKERWQISSFVICCIFFFAFYRSGLRVETNHLPYKRKYTVWGVTKESADKRQFEINDKDSGRKYKLTVAEYFKETYKKQLRCTFAVFV